MDNLNFNELWKRQNVSQPNKEALMKALQQYKKSSRNGTIRLNLVLLLTSGFIGWVWYHYQPDLISTKAGIVLVMLAMIIYLFNHNKLFKMFQRLDETLANKDYLQQLIRIKSKQRFLQTKLLNAYFIALSVGLALYMYEFAIRMTWQMATVCYAVTGGWILLNWIYFRPKQIKKKNKKIDDLIERCEQVSEPLND